MNTRITKDQIKKTVNDLVCKQIIQNRWDAFSYLRGYYSKDKLDFSTAYDAVREIFSRMDR